MTENNSEFLVTRCPPDELFWQKFLLYLSERHRHELGFLPALAYKQAIELGRVFLCLDNGEPAGYLIHGPAKRESKIYQVVVTHDCRRIEHGTALVTAARMFFDAGMAETMSCHVADDLAANSFWQAIGLKAVGTRCRRQDRKRSQIKYQEERPGKAAALLALKSQLAESKLSNLHRILVKGDASIGGVNFKRKTLQRHQIIM